MKVYTLFCPNCGASLNIKSDKNSFFCTHCGSQILVDDETQRIEITTNINYTTTDNTKIEEVKSKERVELQKLENESKSAWIGIVVMLCLFAFALLMAILDNFSII